MSTLNVVELDSAKKKVANQDSWRPKLFVVGALVV